ncbi:phage minor capsid protein [Adlercreutzia sp.]|uniref:phage minor capsid protein n=1 Tax=Adlercreutzia sp. TaxID=1872387 RepID=UPI003AB7759D
MLSPDQIEEAGERVAAVYREIEARMLDHLARVMAEGWGESPRTVTEAALLAQSQAEELRRMVEEFRPYIDAAVLEVVEECLEASDEDDVARAGGSPEWPAQIDATAKGMAEVLARENIQMAEGAKQAFLNASIEAVTRVNSGDADREAALHRAVRKLERDGIEIITYQDADTGRVTVRNKADVAVRRHVRTQIVQDAQRMTMARMERLGIDLVEVSSHSDSRPSHAEWQGQCYSLKGEQVIDGVRYPDFYLHCMSGDLGDILGGVNCRHSYGPYRHGAPRMYEPDPQHPSGLPGEEVYELEQGQRYRERKIREAKRELRGARMLYDRDKSDANLAEYLKAKQLLRNRQEKMRAYIDGANAKSKTGKPVLHRKPDREWAGDMPKGGVAVSAASRKRAMERAALKERCLRAKYPVFDRDELGRIGRATQTARKENGRYDVVMHGSPQIALPYLERADARLIADVLRSRDDYHGEPVRLLSCYTGRANERGECFAQRLADELGVTVTAPDGMLWLKDDGGYSIGENEDENTGSMVEYKPRRKH